MHTNLRRYRWLLLAMAGLALIVPLCQISAAPSAAEASAGFASHEAAMAATGLTPGNDAPSQAEQSAGFSSHSAALGASGGGAVDPTVAAQAQQATAQAWDDWIKYQQQLHDEQVQEQKRKAELAKERRLFYAPATEVWAGVPLNELLDDLTKMQDQGTQLPPVYLQEDTLTHLNLTSGLSGGNVGVLKQDGKLNWPLPMTGPEFKTYRDAIGALAPKLVDQVKKGKPDLASFQEMNRQIFLINQELLGHVGQMDSSEYMQMKHFVNDLRDAVKVLQQPDAASFFNKTYKAKGKTVSDLVAFMSENALKFAPATPNDKAAYLVFYRAMSSCDRIATQTSDQAQTAPADAANPASPPPPGPPGVPPLPSPPGAQVPNPAGNPPPPPVPLPPANPQGK